MPKREIRRAAQIKAVQEGASVNPEVTNDLPSIEEQNEAMTPTAHKIELIDKSIIEMPAQLTIEQLLRKRIREKIIAIRALIQTEVGRFAGLNENDAVVTVIMSSDKVLVEICQLLSKLTNQPLERFVTLVNGVVDEANISGEEVLRSLGVLYGTLVPKNAAAKK